MSGNRKGKTTNCLFFSLAACTLLSCTLDDAIERGDRCPPRDISAKLAYIQMGPTSQCHIDDLCFAKSFQTGECPKEHSACFLNEANEFYCMSPCQKGQIACNGHCINPSTDNNYCGAVNTCTNGYGCCSGGTVCAFGEACQNGSCIKVACTPGEIHCENGVVYACTLNSWNPVETCDEHACSPDGKTCQKSTSCLLGSNLLLNGTTTCNGTQSIVFCNNGILETQETCAQGKLCTLNNGIYSCAEPEFESCSLNGTTVLHGHSICDGQNLRNCINGQLDAGTPCPTPGAPTQTICSIDACVEPSTCSLNGQNVAHNALVCDGNILKTCQNGVLDIQTDCSQNQDGNIFCDNAHCTAPKSCLVNGNTVEHDAVFCTDNSITQCINGKFETIETCPGTQECRNGVCVSQYRTIRSVHQDYDRLVDLSTCSNGEFVTKSDVQIEGVVTAVNGNSGLFVQEPGNGIQNGIYVACPKLRTCTTYPDKTQAAVGDNIRVTSTGINNYYCQLQLFDPDKDPVIEKNAGQSTIIPLELTAAQVPDEGIDGASNIYNGSLVHIEKVTAQNQVTETIGSKPYDEGWNSLDVEGDPVLIGNFLTSLPMTENYHYAVTGIVYYKHNHLQIAPRSDVDISGISMCSTSDSGYKCFDAAGKSILVKCDPTAHVTVESCDKSKNLFCDANTQTCREGITCLDGMNNVIQEGKSGCLDNTTNAICQFPVCSDGGKCDTNTGIWANQHKCANGCVFENGKCAAATISQCLFDALNKQSGSLKVEIPDDTTVATQLRCIAEDASKKTTIDNWPYSSPMTETSCSDCGKMTKFTTALANFPSEEGKYVCAAIVSVTNGKSYICPVQAGASPVEFTPSSIVQNGFTQGLAIERPTLVHFSFDDHSMNPDASSIKQNSSFSLASSQQKVDYLGTIDLAVASMAGWSTAETPNFEKDPHWEVALDTLGYKNIVFSFLVKASGTKNKSFQVAYKTGNNNFTATGNVLSFSDSNGSWKPWNGQIQELDNQPSVVLGIFPFKTANPNVRIDEVRVSGDAL